MWARGDGLESIEISKVLPRQKRLDALIRAAGRHLSGHTLTLLSALHACRRALLAVIRLMFRAFLATVAAHLGTKGAELFCVFAFATHQDSRHRANVCAVTVKLDASSHHLYIIFS